MSFEFILRAKPGLGKPKTFDMFGLPIVVAFTARAPISAVARSMWPTAKNRTRPLNAANDHKANAMLRDRYGNPLTTGSKAARDAYVDAVDRFLSADGGVEQAFRSAIDADENFALAHIGLARMYQMQGHRALIAEPLAQARAQAKKVTPQETGQIGVLGLLLDGRVRESYDAILAHLREFPRDAMVAQTCMGVFGLIGFSGQPGREALQLAFTSTLAPHYGDDWWFLSQHAFAQLEVGQVGPAAVAIEKSLKSRPRSAHSAHVRAHLYYENGEMDAGATYLEHWCKDYDPDGLLHCHVSWHVALWALARGDEATMWRVIDADISTDGTRGPAINVVTDAAAVLYRAEMAGVAVPKSRWRDVSAYAARHFPKPGLAFVDVHAALAHALAGNAGALDKIISDAKGPAGDVVRACAQGFSAMARGNWDAAIRHFTPVMRDHARLGGSNAQRDLLEFAFACALLRAGDADSARLFLSTRRPNVTASSVLRGL